MSVPAEQATAPGSRSAPGTSTPPGAPRNRNEVVWLWRAIGRVAPYGELFALRRRDVGLERASVRVVRNLQQLEDGTLVMKEPKVAAGSWVVAVPAQPLPDLGAHLEREIGPGPGDPGFTGERGGPFRPHVLQRPWSLAGALAEHRDAHLRDLRDATNT